jgi:uncharacterized protein YecE (DUF72 family)
MIRIGLAEWSYKDCEGIVYPPNPPKGFHGATYSPQFFVCIEVDSSFYRTPAASPVRGWVKRVSANPNLRLTQNSGAIHPRTFG